MYKICADCKVKKQLYDFNKYCRSKDGRQSYCKECQCKIQKKYYYKNKDVLNKKRIEWRNSSPENKHKDKISYYKWKANNKESYVLSWKKSNALLKLNALTIVGRGEIKCVNCGCDNIDFLEINHKNCNGRKLKEGGMHLYSAIKIGKRNIDDLDLRCKLCNNLHYLEFKYGKHYFEVKWKKV